jgi:hypothetical protein
MAYKATAPGITNATMTFKYGVETTTSKTPVGDSISRFFAFSIQPGTQQPAAIRAAATPDQMIKKCIPMDRRSLHHVVVERVMQRV